MNVASAATATHGHCDWRWSLLFLALVAAAVIGRKIGEKVHDRRNRMQAARVAAAVSQLTDEQVLRMFGR